MARNLIELKDQDEPRKSANAREAISARAIDLDRTIDLDPIDLDKDEAQFLRTQRRVPVRRGPLPAKAVSWLKIGLWTAAVVIVFLVIKQPASSYFQHSSRFPTDSTRPADLSAAH